MCKCSIFVFNRLLVFMVAVAGCVCEGGLPKYNLTLKIAKDSNRSSARYHRPPLCTETCVCVKNVPCVYVERGKEREREFTARSLHTAGKRMESALPASRPSL